MDKKKRLRLEAVLIWLAMALHMGLVIFSMPGLLWAAVSVLCAIFFVGGIGWRRYFEHKKNILLGAALLLHSLLFALNIHRPYWGDLLFVMASTLAVVVVLEHRSYKASKMLVIGWVLLEWGMVLLFSNASPFHLLYWIRDLLIGICVFRFSSYHEKHSIEPMPLQQQLRVAKQMCDNGIITEEEYNKQCEAVLSSIYLEMPSDEPMPLQQQLQVTKQMYDNGIITEEKYNKQREAVLSQM